MILLGLALNLSACNPNENDPINSGVEILKPDDNNGGENSMTSENTNNMKLKITIGSKSYTATLYDNATAREFKTMLPMTLNMNEHNQNEKYSSLSKNLSTAASNPGTIHTGDLMLFGMNTLVLFYKTFSPSYNYTKIGEINDSSGLEAALGTGSVSVVFEQLNETKSK